jgi:lipopolysaccharide biosynthesis regulator YciM
MGAALVLLLVGLGCMAAGVLIGRYYVPDDRQLRRSARHARSYMKALSYRIARDHETVISELRNVVEENVDDIEPYFALGALFRSRGEHERAIRVHQALAVRERDRRKVRQRAMYELGLDFRAAGMPRRATKAMEEVLLEDPAHEGALRALSSLYEEQGRYSEAAGLWQRLGKRRGEDTSAREHHLLVAAAQAALGHEDPESAKHLLKQAQRLDETAHFYAVAAELAAARDNHRGAKERLRQALVAEPALAPFLLPGLIAAEQGLDEAARAGTRGSRTDELADPDPPAAGVGGSHALSAGDGQAALPAGDANTGAANGSTTSAAEQSVVVVGELAVATATAAAPRAVHAPDTVPLVPAQAPVGTITDRVLALLTAVEAETGPRIELALIRAQLAAQGRELAIDDALASELASAFPDALAARVAAARLALARADERSVRQALELIAGERGTLAWALRGRWQCDYCGNRPGAFSWRCTQCRRWGTLRMETGVEPPPPAPRDRRAATRTARSELDDSRPRALLGDAPTSGLPMPTLDPGLSDEELVRAGMRRSLLGRVGGWFSGVWRRG